MANTQANTQLRHHNHAMRQRKTVCVDEKGKLLAQTFKLINEENGFPYN